MPEDDLAPPRKNSGDSIHAVVTAAIAGIPLVGGPAAELVSHVFGPPLEERRAAWMDVVADVVRRLREDRGIESGALRNDPVFIDVVLRATQTAIRTSSELKRDALRHAMANTALRRIGTEIAQEMFLAYVEEFSEMHLRILDVMAAPGPAARARSVRLQGTTPSQVLELLIPELRGRRDVYDQLWSDLRRRGLVSIENLHVMMSDLGGSRATALGGSFLEFVRSPFPDAARR